MKKTKIIGTIGPASMEYSTMKKMVLAGLNIVRINLSHAVREDMEKIFENVKKLRKELNRPIPIMVDTRGPELRVKTFKNGSVNIKKGQRFVFTSREIEGDENCVSINLGKVVSNVKPGNKILACDGLLVFRVEEVTETDIITKSLTSGVIANRKSLSIPNITFSVPYLNALDKADLVWSIEHDADFVAASFVNTADDVIALRNFLKKNNSDMKIISKIESACGVKNLDAIIDVSDALMVARGDLGVEVPMSKLPNIQKTMIKKSLMKGKPVITATEMLESMITQNRPTRAEVSDVANAVYDGTSCVMLSGETAAGKYPVEAVRTMATIAEETERNIDYASLFSHSKMSLCNATDTISYSAVSASFNHNVKSIVTFTNSGNSAGMVSRFRPSVAVLGATPRERAYRSLELFWGIVPIKTPEYDSTDEMFEIANTIAKKNGYAKAGDMIVTTCGIPKQDGSTCIMKVSTIK